MPERTRFRPACSALVGLTVLGAGPLALELWAHAWHPEAIGGFVIFLLLLAVWTLGYVVWLGSHRFDLTPDALVRRRIGGSRAVPWTHVRAVRLCAVTALGAEHVPIFQATFWEVTASRGHLPLTLPGVMARGLELRTAIEALAASVRDASASSDPDPGRDDRAHAVDARRRRRWAQPPTRDGIPIPRELALILVPTLVLSLFALVLVAHGRSAAW